MDGDLLAERGDVLPPRHLTDEEYLDQAEGEIRGYGRMVISSIVAIGKRLVEIKGRVGHGHYEAFVRDRLGFSQPSAWRYVQSYEVFKSFTVNDLDDLQLDMRSLYLLVRPSTSDQVRAEALEKAASEGISHEEVKQLIADAAGEAANKATEAAERAAAKRIDKMARANAADAERAALDAARLTEQIRQHELTVARNGQRIAELEVAATTVAETERIDAYNAICQKQGSFPKPPDFTVSQLRTRGEAA